MASISKPASNTAPTETIGSATNSDFESWSKDSVKAVGLQDINVDVDSEVTIAANSTAKSAAIADNVTGDSGSLSEVTFNSGLQATTTNLIDVASNSGLSGIATTTANASASTSKGNATGFATLGDAAGISDLDLLKVGGELTALGKSVSTITGSAETVVGSAQAAGKLSGSMEGFEGSRMSVSSDASLQGLSSLTNTATAAATSGGNATAEATAATIQGADLDGLKVGGTASLAGQASLGNTSDASNVVGNSVALSDLTTAQGLVASSMGLDTNGALASGEKGINVSSDASITGLSSITSKATAATTAGLADADSTAGDIDGAKLADALIGGVGSITGQATFNSAASASNVTKGSSNGNSTADSTLSTADGLQASDLLKVNSDATLKGLTSINMSAMAESTGATGATTLADAAFSGGAVTGAAFDDVEIGGIGNVLGQAGFTGAASGSNVTGKAEATGDLSAAMGLKTLDNMTVSSDATLKGISSVTGSATAETTAGDANAAARAGNINGADLTDLVDIGGIGSIQGAANFNLSAKSTNVTAGTGSDGSDALAGNSSLQAIGLKSAAGVHSSPTVNSDYFGVDIASDASISGTAIGTLKAEALSTATSADALAGVGADLWGAQIADLNVGGVANVTGAAQLTGTATAENVGAINLDAIASSGLDATVTGLAGVASTYNMDVASDATITAQAFGTLNATATSTGGDATARAGQYTSGAGESTTVLTGLDTGLDLSIGGVGTLNALAQGSENASATTVDGIATASAGLDLNGAIGLDFASSSDGSLTGMAKLAATASASSTADTAAANGDFSAVGFDGLAIGSIKGVMDFDDSVAATQDVAGIGGISTLKGQAQITGTLNAESVSGDALAGVGDYASSLVGMHNVVLNGASDGTILGTASGVFNTNAINIGGAGFDASGFSSQSLKGIDQIDLHLGGNGGINAIVNDQNFVTAHSVSGNATSVASVDAIGLAGGDMHIAGNASILANVGVDSKSEAHTVA